MKLTETRFERATPVDSYGPGFFRIGGAVIDGAVLVTAQSAAQWGGLDDTDPITDLAGQIDVLLLGTGPEMTHPPASLTDRASSAGIGVEVMASPAACRTYNVLLAEGRRIALAALPV